MSMTVVLSNPDLLVLIFSRLRTTAELGRAAQCCRLWRTSSASNDVWRPVVFAAFPATRGLIGVQSYKALHARMSGINPTRVVGFDDYQFMVVLQYEGRTVLQATVQGSDALGHADDPDEANDDVLETHIPGEDYRMPAWELDANMDLSWLADTHEEPSDDDNHAAFEQFSADMRSFLDAAHTDCDVASKLVLTVTAFRASDQRTAVLLRTGPDTSYADEDAPGIAFTTMPQTMLYPGVRHRRRTNMYPDTTKDALILLCNFSAERSTDTDDPDDLGICWEFGMFLDCEMVSHGDPMDPMNTERVGVPTVEFLRYLEGARWV